MRVKSAFWVCALLSAVAYGCVLSTEPVGRVPEAVELRDWEGVWVHEESFDIDAVVAVVKVASVEDARFDVSWLEIEGRDVQLRKWTGLLRELEGELFLNLEYKESEGDRTRYFWARIEKDGDVARAWIPHHDEIEKLVAAGTLSGEVDRGDFEITLDALDASEARVVSSSTFPTMPVLLRRIGN